MSTDIHFKDRGGIGRPGFRVAAAAVLLLGMAGCAELDELFWFGDEPTASDGTPLQPDLTAVAGAPPAFMPGDRFAFDNPDVVWEVVAVQEGTVTWRADNGDMQKTDVNPLLPALEWASVGQGRGKRLITDMTDSFFPLRVGKQVGFRSTVSTDQPPYAWEFDWQCIVEGFEKVKILIGEFDTYRIACGRQQPDELTFYYAPEVGHYVRLVAIDLQGGKPEQRELRAFRRVSPAPVIAAMQRMEATDAMIPAGETAAMASKVDSETIPGSDAMTETAMPSATDTMAFGTDSGQAPDSGLSKAGDAMLKSAEAAPGAEQAATGLGVHLASYKNPDNTEAGWRQAMARNPSVLDGTRPVVRRVDLGTKGVFYRLHAGPIASRSEAETMCKAIKARGNYCKIVQL